MTINVVCTECESRLTVQEDLLGRNMRCPICREIFVVAVADELPVIPAEPAATASAERPAIARVEVSVPKYTTGTIDDFVQVLPTEPVEPPNEIVWSEPPAAEPEPIPPLDDGPTEVVWTEGDTPGNEPTPPDAIKERLPTPVREVVRPRKKRSRLAVLIVLLLFAGGTAAVGGVFLMRYLNAAPDRLFEVAKRDYAARNYESARRSYEEFARDYPADPRAPEASFFTELSALRSTAYSLGVRADPAPAVAQFDKFLLQSDGPSMKPFTEPGKFGVDIWETAAKLLEEVTSKGLDAFNRDKPDDSAGLLEQARHVGAIVDRFRPKDLDRESSFSQIAELDRKITDGQARLAFLAEVRERLNEPDDAMILAARKQAEDAGHAGDAQFQQLIDAADRKMADRVTYARFDPPIMAVRDRKPTQTGVLFAPRLDPVRKQSPVGNGVFFAQHAGILYALAEGDGHVLWAARSGIDSTALPVVIPGTDLHPDLAILLTNDGTTAGITACLLRTGETFWQQSLPAAPIAQTTVVGQRLFVPLHDPPMLPGTKKLPRDQVGQIIEIELTTGTQIGRISLGRSLGSAGIRRPGSGHLYFAAQARGIYVFDVDKIGHDGQRADPTFLGMINTGHAPGQLHGQPLITTNEGDSGSFMLLSLSDGLDAMKLQAFPLPPADQVPAVAGALPPAIALPGWLSFPPYVDAEKLAVVTDRGVFGLFGIRQAGNLDSPLFVLPAESHSAGDAHRSGRGQIVHADENSFWLLAQGQLRQLQLSLDFERGLRLVPRGNSLTLGEPLQPAQVIGNLAFVVTQVGPSCRATAIDLRTGSVRWQRQIGLVAERDPLRLSDSVVLIDQAGGLYRLNAESLATANSAEWLIDERWLIAPPFADTVGPTWLLPTGTGATTIGLANSDGKLNVVVREYDPAKGVRERSGAVPAMMAGNPIVVGRSVMLPLMNGMLYRLLLDEPGKPVEAGPTWRGDKVNANEQGWLSALSDSEFIAGDGGKGLVRWRWAVDSEEFSRVAGMSLSEKLGAPALVVGDANKRRVMLADVKGNVTLWDADRLSPTAQPLQSWRTNEKGPILPGKLTAGPMREGDGRISYIVDGTRIVRLRPVDVMGWEYQDTIRVEHSAIVGRPMLSGDRLMVTTRKSRIDTFNNLDGSTVGPAKQLPGNAAPAAAAIPLDAKWTLVPLSDGTLLLVP